MFTNGAPYVRKSQQWALAVAGLDPNVIAMVVAHRNELSVQPLLKVTRTSKLSKVSSTNISFQLREKKNQTKVVSGG